MSGVELIRGRTFHGRRGALENAFHYSVDFVLCDAEAALETPRLFSRNARNLLSLRDRDHGGPPGQGRGAAWARDVLERHQVHAPGPLRLLAQPRMLGYVFNPVSFWLAHDAQDRLVAVIAEVTNTYGDRHSYLAARPDGQPIGAEDRLGATKLMHVSPFQPVAGDYEFRFDIRPDKLGIWIDFGHAAGGVLATLVGRRQPLTARRVLGSVLRRPLATRRVMALIHWQALKLWWKGARFSARPKPPEAEVSR